MKLQQDFKEFIELLNAHEVNYLIVGGYAVGFHSRPKFTQDLDIWIENRDENASRVLAVLREFGFAGLDITAHELTNPDIVVQLGNAPIRIDLMTSASGVDFSDAFDAKVEGTYLGVRANFISLNDLIANKRSSGRKKDLADIDWLEEYGPA